MVVISEENANMPIRKNIWPKCIQDAVVTAFVFVIIPIVYYFELFIVLPTYYNFGSGWYIFHFVSGTLILWNICSNLVAIMLSETSIKGRMLPVTLERTWRFCSICESVVPPRSWHCNICNVCILKRDHHCIFTSCCIGHHNQRYFVVFVFYMFIATLYATYHNTFFVLEFLEFKSWRCIFNFIFPLVAIVLNYSVNQLYILLYLIIIIGCMFTGVLLAFHTSLIMKGIVTHERKETYSKYDQGWKLNVKDALGDRWYLIWLSPFLRSELPRDGIHWETKQSFKAK